MLNDVGRAFLIRRKNQHVASVHVERKPPLRLLVNHEQFRETILLLENIRRSSGERETLHGYFRIGGEQHVFLVRVQAQCLPGFVSFRWLEDFEIHFVWNDKDVGFLELSRHFLRLNNRGIHVPR